jgi:LuxR family maltose regulon positive regulatory protein
VIPTDVSVSRGLLDREALLELMDRAVTKRLTVISAPPGSGKTTLLRAWADRPTNPHRVAFVSVDRGQQNAERFWRDVSDAIRDPDSSVEPETQPGATAALDGVLSDLAEQVEPVVLHRAGQPARRRPTTRTIRSRWAASCAQSR